MFQHHVLNSITTALHLKAGEKDTEVKVNRREMNQMKNTNYKITHQSEYFLSILNLKS